MKNYYDSIDYLDHFSSWIIDVKRTDGAWIVKLHPNRIVESQNMSFVVDQLKKHVVAETIELCCDAMGISVDYILEKHRKQEKADYKFAVAIVLTDLFKFHISLIFLARQLGWNNHTMFHHADNNREVKPIAILVQKIYSRYPFLKDGFKSLRA